MVTLSTDNPHLLWVSYFVSFKTGVYMLEYWIKQCEITEQCYQEILRSLWGL